MCNSFYETTKKNQFFKKKCDNYVNVKKKISKDQEILDTYKL